MRAPVSGVSVLALLAVLVLSSCGPHAQSDLSASALPPATPTLVPLSSTITTRKGLQVHLSDPHLQYAVWGCPLIDMGGILDDCVYVRLDYIKSIEFGNIVKDQIAKAPVSITLIDGSKQTYDYEFSYSPPEQIVGESDLGHFEAPLTDIRSIVFSTTASSVALPTEPPAPSDRGFSGTVTDAAGVTTPLSSIRFHFYFDNTFWTPPIVTNAAYTYLPLASGSQVSFEKIATIEIGEIVDAQENSRVPVALTLADGKTMTDEAKFDVRTGYTEPHLVYVEGNAALGRFVVGLPQVRTITLQH